MKHLYRKNWVFVFCICIIILFGSLVIRAVSERYFSDMETAIKWGTNFKSITKITTICGKEGIVYLGKDNNSSIQAFNFKNKVQNNQVMYKVGDTTGIIIADLWMKKMHTAPNSREEIVYGIGEKYAQECVEKTGKEANYISLKDNGKTYILWYIISEDGLNELPEHQIGGVPSNVKPSLTPAILPALFIVFIGIAIFSIRKSRETR